jgi:Flp pilus assembly protein TadB
MQSAPEYAKTSCGRGDEMLWFIFLVLLVLWILGLVGTYQIGAWLWLLLVAAVIVLIVQLATGRRVAP